MSAPRTKTDIDRAISEAAVLAEMQAGQTGTVRAPRVPRYEQPVDQPVLEFDGEEEDRAKLIELCRDLGCYIPKYLGMNEFNTLLELWDVDHARLITLGRGQRYDGGCALLLVLAERFFRLRRIYRAKGKIADGLRKSALRAGGLDASTWTKLSDRFDEDACAAEEKRNGFYEAQAVCREIRQRLLSLAARILKYSPTSPCCLVVLKDIEKWVIVYDRPHYLA